MTELPFVMEFELDFTSKNPSTEVLGRIYDEISNILPKPLITVNLGKNTPDKALLSFFEYLNNENFEYRAIIENPILNNDFKAFHKIVKNEIYITTSDYKPEDSFAECCKIVIPTDLTENLYQFLKEINRKNVQSITIEHKNTILPYEKLQTELKKIREDEELGKKCFLLPYLEEREQEILYSGSDKPIRPFLTCAALWVNPTIDADGKIAMPCADLGNIKECRFLDLWDSDRINELRDELIRKKQFENCKNCKKFYNKCFFIAENAKLDYKGCTFTFDEELNFLPSAPIVAIATSEAGGGTVIAIPVFSDEEILRLFNAGKLVAVLK